MGHGELLTHDDGCADHREPPPSILLPAPLTVVAQPSLFRAPSHRRYDVVPHGKTVLELVLDMDMGQINPSPTDPTIGIVSLPLGHVVVTIDGHLIERRYWHCCRPRPGRLVNIAVIPTNQRQAILIGASLALATVVIPAAAYPCRC